MMLAALLSGAQTNGPSQQGELLCLCSLGTYTLPSQTHQRSTPQHRAPGHFCGAESVFPWRDRAASIRHVWWRYARRLNGCPLLCLASDRHRSDDAPANCSLALPDEVSAVVIDMGSTCTKSGYAGEDCPKFVIPSVGRARTETTCMSPHRLPRSPARRAWESLVVRTVLLTRLSTAWAPTR